MDSSSGVMRNGELSRQLQRIENLFQRTAQAANNDIEIQAHWAKYLCILCAGFLENSITAVFSDYVRGKAAPPVANYAITSLERIQNPKTQRFLEVAAAFDRSWEAELRKFVALENRGEAVDSIMNNRHQIAHGKQSGITITQLRNWFEKSLEIVDFLETQIQR